jgi:uncharacterized protein (DUF433 family)
MKRIILGIILILASFNGYTPECLGGLPVLAGILIFVWGVMKYIK